jgi:type II secretory pathway pseudopilin PulG
VITAVLISGLGVFVLYLVVGWRASRAENDELRTQVASLKRQLTKYGRSR